MVCFVDMKCYRYSIIQQLAFYAMFKSVSYIWLQIILWIGRQAIFLCIINNFILAWQEKQRT